MKRKFEIELDVPDDFDAAYNMPYQFGGQCVISDGSLCWNVYADPKAPTPQWRIARASDEGNRARFRDAETAGWSEGKLLHVDPMAYLALTKGGPVWFEFCEVQV
jgi:hypothetical protein